VRAISFAGRAAPAPVIIEVASAFDLYCQLTGVNHRPQSRLTGEIIPTQIFLSRIFTELVKQDQAKSPGLA
jgi:hypothetical protein